MVVTTTAALMPWVMTRGEKLKNADKKKKAVNLNAASVYQTRSESKHPENGDIFTGDLVCQSRALQRKQSVLHYQPPALTLFISRLHKERAWKSSSFSRQGLVEGKIPEEQTRNEQKNTQLTHQCNQKERKEVFREGSPGPAGDQGSGAKCYKGVTRGLLGCSGSKEINIKLFWSLDTARAQH